MKVQLIEKEIKSYELEVEVEREGEKHRVSISYNPYDGYEVAVLDERGNYLPQPDWAQELDEQEGSLGYYLEEQLNGRFYWAKDEEVAVNA